MVHHAVAAAVAILHNLGAIRASGAASANENDPWEASANGPTYRHPTGEVVVEGRHDGSSQGAAWVFVHGLRVHRGEPERLQAS